MKNHYNSRRKFLQNSAKLSAGIPLLSACSFNTAPEPAAAIVPSDKPMKILILGGTSFLGPHQIAYALERGHSVTTFTRGKTKPTVHKELFEKIESLVGDRNDNLEALKGRKWDVVIDNSGRQVKWTEDTANLLKDNAEMYLYVSSVSAYYPFSDLGPFDESREVLLTPPTGEEYENNKMTWDYGIMKANSEKRTREIFGEDRSIIIRPHFIVGPGDRTDRFIYWVDRLAKGGEVLLPGADDRPVQYIDVRDMAGFMIRLLEQRVSGTFNGAGPGFDMTTPQFVHGAHAAFNSPVNFVRVDDFDFLKENGVFFLCPWILPDKEVKGMPYTDTSAAIAAGLTFRPLADTIRTLYNWWISDDVPEERRTNLAAGENAFQAKEADLIKAWKQRG